MSTLHLYGLMFNILAACAGCFQGAQPKAPLSVIVSGDTAGWIVPCGCTSNQSGGLLRRGTFIQTAGEESSVVYVDVGGAVHGTTAYDVQKFTAILRGESSMKVQAHNIGAGEATLGAQTLIDLRNRTGIPLVSCNVRRPDGSFIGEALRILSRAGRKIAVTGVLSDRKPIPGVRIDPPRDAILETIRSSAGKYDSLVVLAYLPEEELVRLAAELPEADIVVGGPTGQSIAPRRVGQSLVASATNKGKFLVRFEAPSDGTSAWTGTVVEMDANWRDDPTQRDNLHDFYRQLAERDLPAAESPFAAPLLASLPADFQVAGTDRCRDCHERACLQWDESSHARAWQSLTRTGAQVDAYCQQCHTTAFGLPGGFVSAKRSADLANVGCESCHGPSRSHVENPRESTAYSGQALGRCDYCHDRENSPRFARNDYWLKIEHGEQIP